MITQKLKKWLIKSLLKLSKNNFSSDVYCLTLENTNNHPAKAIIFGYNHYFGVANYGSDNGVNVENNYSTYEHLLFETQLETKFKKVQLISSADNLKERMFYFYRKTAFGLQVQIPVILNEYYREDQVLNNVINVNNNFVINGNKYFEIELLPKEKLSINFFGELTY